MGIGGVFYHTEKPRNQSIFSIVFHPWPPQRYSKMRERDIEAHLVKRVKELGGEIRKVKWIGRSKAPDRVVLRNADQWAANVLGTTDFTKMSFTERAAFARRLLGRYIVWPELKAPGKQGTFPADGHERGQDREHKRMRKMGQRVVVIDSIEGVEELLS